MDLAVLLQQLLQAELRPGHRPPLQTHGLVQLHGQAAPAEVLQKAVVHRHHVLGGEAVAGPPSRHHRRGVQLEGVEGVGAEGGGFAVAQQLQRRWREGGVADPELQEVLAALQAESLVGRLRGLVVLVAVVVGPEDAGFGAVGDFPELSWRREARELVDRRAVKQADRQEGRKLDRQTGRKLDRQTARKEVS